MVVHDGDHVRAGFVDLGMDETFRILRAAPEVDGDAIERVLDDVGLGDDCRRARGRHQEAARIEVVANTHVTVRVDDAVGSQRLVCCNEIQDELRVGGAGRGRVVLCVRSGRTEAE